MCIVGPIMWLSVMSTVSASHWISTPADLTRCEGESVDLVWVYQAGEVKAVAIQKTSSYVQIKHVTVKPARTKLEELHLRIDHLNVSDSDTYEALVASKDGILIDSAVLTILPSSDSDCPSISAYYSPVISVMVNDKPYPDLHDEQTPITVHEGDLLTITAHIQQTQPHIVVISSLNGEERNCVDTECTIQIRLIQPGECLYSLTLKHEYRQDSKTIRNIIVKAGSLLKESITNVKARTTDTTLENSESHLSAGIIVGISVGVLVILGLIAAAMIFLVLRFKHNSNGSKEKGEKDDDKKEATMEETLPLNTITTVSEG